jgi:hypothetical protein
MLAAAGCIIGVVVFFFVPTTFAGTVVTVVATAVTTTATGPAISTGPIRVGGISGI